MTRVKPCIIHTLKTIVDVAGIMGLPPKGKCEVHFSLAAPTLRSG